MEKTAIELFAGVGGFRCGLNHVKLENDIVTENGNFKFLWANQFEPATKSQDAFECYKKRFNDKNLSNEDINLVDMKSIPKHTLILGGFPCQDYSVARTLSNEQGIEGKKGVLWWAIDKVLRAKKTPFGLLENVDRLLISPAKQRGRDFGIILRSLMDNGYGVEWRVINAAEYGLAQKRRRTYIFIFRNNTKYYKRISKFSPSEILLKEGVFAKQFAVEQTVLEDNASNVRKDSYKDLIEVSNNFKCQFYNSGVMINGKIYTAKVKAIEETPINLSEIRESNEVADTYFLNKDNIEKFKFLKGGKRLPRVKPNGEQYFYTEGAMAFPDMLDSPARTMLTSEGSINRSTHVIEDYKTGNLRVLTPVECERINGFPDNWTDTGMSTKRRNFMMGNALVVGVISRIGCEIERIIANE